MSELNQFHPNFSLPLKYKHLKSTNIAQIFSVFKKNKPVCEQTWRFARTDKSNCTYFSHVYTDLNIHLKK